MKKIINAVILPVAILLVLIGGNLTASGQCGEENPALNGKGQSMKAGATPVYPEDNNNSTATLEKDYPNVARNFNLLFPEHCNPLWLVKQNNLHVYFSADGKKTRAVFSADGPMKYAITDLNEKGFPKSIKQRIAANFSRYSVINIKEITTPENTLYQVILENNKGFVALQLDDDEMEIVQRMKKH